MATATWHVNDTESLTVTVTENGVNVDSLAGATISFALYNAAGAAVVSKTTGDFTVSAPTFSLTLGGNDLDNLSGVYRYECRITDASGATQSADGDVYIQAMTL